MTIWKRIIRGISAVMLLLSFVFTLRTTVFAAELFDYAKYKKSDAYSVECKIEDKVTYSDREQLSWTPEVRRSGGDIRATYRLIQLGESRFYDKTVYEQPITFHFDLPGAYTTYFSEGRTCEIVEEEWYGAEYEKTGNAHKKATTKELPYDRYAWYRDADYDDGTSSVGSAIMSYISADVTCGPGMIGVFTDADLKRWDKTWEEYIAQRREEHQTNPDGTPHEKDKYECKETTLSDGVMFSTYHYDWIERPNANGTGEIHSMDGVINRIEALKNEQETWETYIYLKSDAYPGIYFAYGVGVSTYVWYDNGTMAADETTAKMYDEYVSCRDLAVNTIYPALQSMRPTVTVGEGTGELASDVAKQNVVADTYAKDEAGEDGGTTIPSIIILGTLGAGAALAGAAGQGGEDDKKKRSQFKMYINKNFGSSLKKGEPPQDVFARIAEITPDGREIPRPDLTEQIRVYSSDDSLIVKDGGMANGYRRAVVSVYDTEDQPPEGKVSFFFEGEGGTFTQNVIFNITVPGIKFFQENLTLPAGILEEPEFLPFEVSEMGDKYEIELSYNGENYEIDLAECDDKNAHVHYAVFMETNKEIYDAGVYTEGWLNVTVKNESQTLKGSIKVIRMGMGLCLPVNALNCYRVPKKESLGKEMKAMTPADFETSITEATAYVLYYDEENHEVRQMAAFPNVTFAPLEGETDEKKKQIQSALDQIRITPKLLKVDGDFANYAFVCEGGFLDAPTRYFVKMTCAADVTVGAGKTAKTMHCESVREVLLRSQPCRFVAGVKENHEADKYDDQIREMLFGIQKVVFEHYLSQLFPLYNMIDRMTSGFDRNYGYDPYQVAKVVDVWERFQSGELKGIGSDVNAYGVADELEALAAATRSWDGWSGIVLRISLDVMTGGASEIIMVALDVNRAAMDYRKASGGKGTAYGYFKAMAIPLVFGAGIGVVAAVGRGASKAIGTAAKKLAPVKTAALMEKAAKVKSVAKEMASLAAADAKRAAGYVVSKIPQGAKTVGDKIGKAINAVVETVDKFDPRLHVPKAQNATGVVSASVNKGKTAGDAVIAEAKAAPKTIQEKCLDMAGNATNKEGEILYNELIAAKKALQANPTSGAAQLKYNQAIMEFKASHAAIEHANSVLPGEQLTMRAVLNEDIERTMASKIEQKFKDKIANKYNIDPNTVRFDRATANKDMSTKFGRDIDWTPKVVTKEGGTKYVSQATADELLEQAVRETVEETCGKEFAEQFAAKGGFARKLDQTACTIQHKDFFQGGLDTVQKVTDKSRMGEFMGAEQARSVADTLRFKGAHPYAEGARIEKEVLSGLSDGEANQLLKELENYARADAATAKTIRLSDNAKKLKEAYALMEEGVYQPAKYGKKVVDKEWVAIKNGYGETLSGQDYVNSRILDRGCGQALPGEMMTPGAEWVGERITLSEARKACKLNGTTLEGAINGVGDAFERIDAKLGYATPSQVMGGIGLGGGINTAMNGLGGNGQSGKK